MEDFLSNREIRTVIRNIKSSWKGVISRVPQGCVLAPIMFTEYVNDMIEGIEGYISMFADHAKIMRRVTDQEDCGVLQLDLDKINYWATKWQMEFNIKKCSLMEFGKSNKKVKGNYSLANGNIKKTTEEKDLGVIVT